MQEDFALQENENLESLSAKHQILANSMMLRLMENFSQYWNNATPQTGEASYWPRPSEADRTLEWHCGVEKIDRLSRAFGKMGSYCQFENQYWIVYRLLAWPAEHQSTPGTVIHKTNTEVIVAAADGLVSLQYFEPAPWLEKRIKKANKS